jgi:hypothetical protein
MKRSDPFDLLRKARGEDPASLSQIQAPAPPPKSNFKFRQYQKEDLARAALHDGAILAWDPGLGKTAAAFVWPRLKGARYVLIVAPGGLHEQIIKEGREKFGIECRPLMSQADFYADKLLQTLRCQNPDAASLPAAEGSVPDATSRCPVYWLTTYQALGLNGGDEWSPRFDENGAVIRNSRRENARLAHPAYADALRANVRQLEETFTVQTGAPQEILEKIQSLKRLAVDPAAYKGEVENALAFIAKLVGRYEVRTETKTVLRTVEITNPRTWFDGIGMDYNGIKCVLTPSLATLCQNGGRCLFDAVVVDEGVRLKATESYVSQGIRALRPRFRLVLTGTPIKNVLIDLFWLAHWICGGNEEATARWPYENKDEARERFADEHTLQERNVTQEERAKENTGRRIRRVKRTPEICNIHRLWKLLGPVVIRRRKDDCGEDLVPKVIVPVRVRPGTVQQKVYARYLHNKPIAAKGTKLNPETITEAAESYLHGGIAVGIQLQLLRQAALCPDSPNLAEAILKPEADAYPKKSFTDLNPKSAAILSLIADLLVKGENVIVISPFNHFNERLHKRLCEAGVRAVLADGSVSPLKRGKLAADFKAGVYSVLVGSTESMSEGHSFECCNNLVIPSLTWAMDKNTQAVERVHRLNSTRPVTVYCMVTENTIDVKLESLFREKSDSSHLALDGRLFTEKTSEINLAKLLSDAVANFDPTAATIDEQKMEDEWTRALKDKLRHAQQTFTDPNTPPFRPSLYVLPKSKRTDDIAVAISSDIASPPPAPTMAPAPASAPAPQAGYKFAIGQRVSFIGNGGVRKTGTIERLSTTDRYEVKIAKNKVALVNGDQLTAEPQAGPMVMVADAEKSSAAARRIGFEVKRDLFETDAQLALL